MINKFNSFIQLLCKPRKFGNLFGVFFILYLCLLLTGFISGGFHDEKLSSIQLIGIGLIMSVLGGIMAAGAWMLVTKSVYRVPNHTRNEDKSDDR